MLGSQSITSGMELVGIDVSWILVWFPHWNRDWLGDAKILSCSKNIINLWTPREVPWLSLMLRKQSSQTSRSRELIQWSGISVSGKSGLPGSSQSLIVKRNVSRWQKKSWDGKIVGNGEMDIDNDQLNKRIDYTLTFLKPFKAVSPSVLILNPKKVG